MKTVAEIIKVLRGDVKGLFENHIRLDVPGFMPLSIEHLGHQGPHGWPVISVMHFYEQCGDLMRDPDMEFEVSPDGCWTPLTYCQHNLGIFQEALVIGPGRKVLVNRKLLKELEAFAKLWDANLREQGYLAAAKTQAAG